ncbi:NADH dehydrogenase [ubiquinone] 1 alpha subcomplex subunit 4-like 2 [Hydractinia symbiolongicarpus]|uniref:NADH dehydrogenase [ubiquinone] 1 alpha subcomplex subunit 4-like 2 n=1 Tax=Hydractinia symbiolongicarpus TaxID=13093 RepID=UPI00254D8569|nr:NADH dehydrogenase [ubiquinone] 1 alpha subcomplex subunit 4-like 2 [Hydractinia symbiolongicarpus]
MWLLRKAMGHPEVYPLVACVGVAASLGIGALIKSTRYPDVVWNHKTNPSPWLDMKQTDEVKWYKTRDYYKNRTDDVPKY